MTLLQKIKMLLGLPVNPYRDVSVKVEGNKLVEYVPGPHVIVNGLPYAYPNMCVDVVCMPGYKLHHWYGHMHNTHVLLFHCLSSIYVYPVIIAVDRTGRVDAQPIHDRDAFRRKLGRRGYKYLMEHSRINLGACINIA